MSEILRESQGGRSLRRSSIPAEPKRRSSFPSSVPPLCERAENEPSSSKDISRLLDHCRTISDSEKAVREMLRMQGVAATTRTLFSEDVWGDYDPSMKKHAHRIETLLWQLADLDRSGSGGREKRIFVPEARIADIGGGSGTIEDILLNVLKPESSGYHFSLVDISESMMKKARAKLQGQSADVDYIVHDILETDHPFIPLPDGSQDIVIKSQVLPFLFDRSAAMEESKSGRLYLGYPHMVKRRQIIDEELRVLKDNGHLVIIDEDPMLYTIASESPEQILRSRIFNVATRMIQQNEFLNGVMKNASEKVRFVCQFDMPIDGHHRMYVMVYRKESPKEDILPGKNGKGGRFPADERLLLRDLAVERILTAMKDVSWWPMVDQEPRIAVSGHNIRDGKVFDTRSNGILGPGNADYDTIVLAEQLFRHHNGHRAQMIRSAIRRLKKGGSLVIIEDFEKQESRQFPYPVRNSYFRETIMPMFGDELSFLGSISTNVHPEFRNAMIGYHYMKFSE